MEGTIFSLIPAVLMLVLVLVTRRVILSLGIGIIVGAFMLTQMDIGAGIALMWSIFAGIFVSEGSLNMGSIYLLVFLFLLGITTAFMTASGGSQAFGKWAAERIRTRRGAKLVPSLLGIVIFIDDYFNALAVGQVARPVTDQYKVSRAKLAYYIDSTSAPITVISPISSWGAYIIGTIGSILAVNEITNYQAFEAFVYMIPANFYVFAALLLVFLTIYLRLDIGSMRTHEKRAQETGELTNPAKGDIPGDLNDEFKEHGNGRISHLILPIVSLVIGTIATMFITGIRNSEGSPDLLAIFANTDVNISLFSGGLVAVIAAVGMYMGQAQPKSAISHVLGTGMKAMLPAIYILISAWMIGDIINQMQTGEFLAQQFSQTDINIAYLPFIIFLLSGFMALSTGTSWGTFGIMLPIAGEIAAVTDPALILPALSAVLAGSVFGDHCSPISDTTILSSTGAGSNHIDHVMTQLPYAVISAIAASIGYIMLGLSGQVWLPLLLTLVVVTIIAFVIHKFNSSTTSSKSE